jgi:tetratricopeptide (TPR) repeat protein
MQPSMLQPSSSIAARVHTALDPSPGGGAERPVTGSLVVANVLEGARTSPLARRTVMTLGLRSLARSARLAALALALSGCLGSFGRALESGDAYARSGQWDYAVSEYERAARLEPERPEAKARLAHARKMQLEVRTRAADELLARGDELGAFAALHDASRIAPHDRAVAARLEAVVERLLGHAEASARGGRPRDGLVWTGAVLARLPSHARAATLDGQLRASAFAAALASADRSLAEGHAGKALVDAVVALSLVETSSDALARRDRALSELRRAATFTVVVGPTLADAASRSLAARITPEALVATLPRSALFAVTTELPPAGARGRGVRLGSLVGGLKVARHQSTLERSCTYTCGSRREHNPAWGSAELEVTSAASSLSGASATLRADELTLVAATQRATEAQRDLQRAKADEDVASRALDACRARANRKPQACRRDEGTLDDKREATQRAERRWKNVEADRGLALSRVAGSRLSRDGAVARLRTAELNLAATPRFVLVPVSCSHVFPSTLHAVDVSASLTLRGEDLVEKRDTLAQEVVPHTRGARDETFPPRPDRCPLEGDPLRLSTADELEAAVATLMLGTLRDRVVGLEEGHLRADLGLARAGSGAEALDAWGRVAVARGGSDDARAATLVLAREAGLEARRFGALSGLDP